MAGSYPDVPGPRIMYDLDGTNVYWHVGAFDPPIQLTSAQISTMNDESDSTYFTMEAGLEWRYLVFIFPVAMTIKGIFTATNDQVGIVEYSTDSTNGMDGSWSTLVSNMPDYTTNYPYYRSDIQTLNVNNIKSIRLYCGTWFGLEVKSVHLYGYPTSSTGTRLEFWKTDESARLDPAAFDFGDTPQGSTASVAFKVKNVSSTLTANNVYIGIQVATDFSPSLYSQYTVNSNGGPFDQTASVGGIAPSSFSPTCILKRNTSASGALGLHALRVNAYASSFS